MEQESLSSSQSSYAIANSDKVIQFTKQSLEKEGNFEILFYLELELFYSIAQKTKDFLEPGDLLYAREIYAKFFGKGEASKVLDRIKEKDVIFAREQFRGNSQHIRYDVFSRCHLEISDFLSKQDFYAVAKAAMHLLLCRKIIHRNTPNALIEEVRFFLNIILNSVLEDV